MPKIQAKRIIMAIGTMLAIGCCTWMYKKMYYENGIQTYQSSRDRQFILDLFKKNWYWLTANDSLIPENVVDYKTNGSPDQNEKFTIKVYLENNTPEGFIAYYKAHLYQGVIRFVAVGEQYRNKGIAQKLIQHALEDLKRRGCITVKILTRMTNYPARATYTKAGFTELWSNEGYIEYQKDLITS